MRVVDLDGNTHAWKIAGRTVDIDSRPRSELHLRTRSLLKQLYPTIPILEEIPIPINMGKTLHLDFYVPLTQLAIEVHGEQHYKFIPFFHGNRLKFIAAKRNDSFKAEWCQINDIRLVVLPYNETDEKWMERINGRTKN